MSVPHQNSSTLPYLGFGLRLRREYLQQVIETRPEVDWFEIITETCLDAGEEALSQLEQLGAHYPLVLHGISLGIGSPWPLDRDYLQKLKRLTERLRPAWVSDHLCWSGAEDIQGKLLPLPYTQDTLEHLVARINKVQEFLERQILLENVPQEHPAGEQELTECEFLREVAERSDSLILIDIATLHSTCTNQLTDPIDYLERLPAKRVQQIHLAGAMILCDSAAHDSDRSVDPIWNLYQAALQRYGPISTMIERLDTIPSLEEMVHEIERARCGAAPLIDQA